VTCAVVQAGGRGLVAGLGRLVRGCGQRWGGRAVEGHASEGDDLLLALLGGGGGGGGGSEAEAEAEAVEGSGGEDGDDEQLPTWEEMVAAVGAGDGAGSVDLDGGGDASRAPLSEDDDSDAGGRDGDDTDGSSDDSADGDAVDDTLLGGDDGEHEDRHGHPLTPDGADSARGGDDDDIIEILDSDSEGEGRVDNFADRARAGGTQATGGGGGGAGMTADAAAAYHEDGGGGDGFPRPDLPHFVPVSHIMRRREESGGVDGGLCGFIDYYAQFRGACQPASRGGGADGVAVKGGMLTTAQLAAERSMRAAYRAKSTADLAAGKGGKGRAGKRQRGRSDGTDEAGGGPRKWWQTPTRLEDLVSRWRVAHADLVVDPAVFPVASIPPPHPGAPSRLAPPPAVAPGGFVTAASLRCPTVTPVMGPPPPPPAPSRSAASANAPSGSAQVSPYPQPRPTASGRAALGGSGGVLTHPVVVAGGRGGFVAGMAALSGGGRHSGSGTTERRPGSRLALVNSLGGDDIEDESDLPLRSSGIGGGVKGAASSGMPLSSVLLRPLGARGK